MHAPVPSLAAALSGRYRVERKLGAGGMATVYLAHDLKHDRPVAIKVLRPELAEVIGAKRFLAEIRTTAGLQHPHILPLHDSGDADGTLYYVTPFVDGVTLRERLRTGGPLSVGDAVRIMGQVASALDYAHRHGVVHRDIKPENILLQDDQALVADFGIAVAMDASEADRLTGTGLSIGTPEYMSPEYVLGEHAPDARSDIYALGVTLYEALTGVPPFTGPSAPAVIARVISERPVPPSRHRRDLPSGVDAIVMRAIEREPGRRFHSAAEMQIALAAIPSNQVPARDTTRQARRARIVAGLIGAALLGGAAYVAVHRADAARRPAAGGDSAPAATRSVIALPFENFGPDSLASAYLADGIPEELLAALSNAPDLAVRPMPRDPRYRLRPDLPSVGRELHADVILTGTVLPEGDSIRVTVRPYDVARNAYLPSVTYTSATTNVFGLEDSMSRALGARLRVGAASRQLLAGAPRGRPTNPAAHDSLLRARWYSEKRDCASLDRAVALLTTATHLDSGYAQAWSDLAQAHDLRAAFLCARGINEFVPARAAVSRALLLDSTLADAHTTLGFLHLIADWDWPRARAAFDRALALDPAKADIWLFHAWYYVALGRLDSARASVRHAEELDPSSSIIRTRVGTILDFSDSVEAAASEVSAVLDREPDFEPARVEMMLLAAASGRCDQALTLLRNRPRSAPNAPGREGTYIYAKARCGDTGAARAALRDWEARAARGEFIAPFQMAIGYAGLNDDAKVLSWLTHAVEERDWQVWELAVFPVFKKYHGNHDFQALVGRVHLPPVS